MALICSGYNSTVNNWLCRYLSPHKVVFDNGSEFKRYFTTFLKYFDIKTVLTLVKNLQANVPVERVHQVILKMLATKNLDKKVFDYMNPWGETLASTAWAIRDSYHRTIMATSGQAVLGRDNVDASNFHINSIAYSIVISDSLVVFSGMINV